LGLSAKLDPRALSLVAMSNPRVIFIILIITPIVIFIIQIVIFLILIIILNLYDPSLSESTSNARAKNLRCGSGCKVIS
jgi:hypothetical protein